MSPSTVRVVIVGASYAGASAARTLSSIKLNDDTNVQITLVERRDHYFHSIGALHGAVFPRFSKRLFVPYDRLMGSNVSHISSLSSPSSSRTSSTKENINSNDDDDVSTSSTKIENKHVTICSELVETHPDHVVLKNNMKVPFDYLVLATGSDNNSPAKTSSLKKEDGMQELKGFNDEVEKAKSILIIGGGGAGVELAGEIGAKYNTTGNAKDSSAIKKKIVLAHSRNKLVGEHLSEAFTKDLKCKLKNLGVEVVLNERLDLPPDIVFDNKVNTRVLKTLSGREFNSDLQVCTIGNRINTKYLETLELAVDAAAAAAAAKDLDSVSSLHLVDPTTNMINILPTMQLANPAFPHIFAPGDVNNRSKVEKKASYAYGHGQVAAKNIEIMIRAGFHNVRSSGDKAAIKQLLESLSLKKCRNPINGAKIPLGPKMGTAEFCGITFSGVIGNFIMWLGNGEDYKLSRTLSLLGYSPKELS
ncbi:hypothetical protein H4219_002843 [Mycoemilia scoparia]|uniref:FAD/NAD(P)-binding domain-containing protein n=1 Tax=Mycoemilia scoparia TaxID=417184 RepID=A0A9W7ZWJ4_9FUNG|nr:hypothetical protein H4219_002843 [Mycoemilia scoparia]